MELAYEGNTNLAFNTLVMRNCATRYSQVADNLDGLSTELSTCLTDLKNTGWTTPAGTAFSEMVNEDWCKCLGKYTGMLRTLTNILNESATIYDELVTGDISVVKLGTNYINGSAGSGRF